MKRIAEQFRLDGAVRSVDALGEGFINDTYIVTTDRSHYVLQRKNRNIFTNIPAMMRNIRDVTSFLKEKVRRAGGDPLREVMTVIPTCDWSLYYKDAAGEPRSRRDTRAGAPRRRGHRALPAHARRLPRTAYRHSAGIP